MVGIVGIREGQGWAGELALCTHFFVPYYTWVRRIGYLYLKLKMDDG